MRRYASVATVFLIAGVIENIDAIDANRRRKDGQEMKNVQIPYELFVDLLRYYLVEDGSCAEEIRQGLEKKLDSMVRHELYTKYKTVPAEEEREKARKEYLDKQGVPDSFRW